MIKLVLILVFVSILTQIISSCHCIKDHQTYSCGSIDGTTYNQCHEGTFKKCVIQSGNRILCPNNKLYDFKRNPQNGYTMPYEICDDEWILCDISCDSFDHTVYNCVDGNKFIYPYLGDTPCSHGYSNDWY